jgi:hypothetical protein
MTCLTSISWNHCAATVVGQTITCLRTQDGTDADARRRRAALFGDTQMEEDAVLLGDGGDGEGKVRWLRVCACVWGDDLSEKGESARLVRV